MTAARWNGTGSSGRTAYAHAARSRGSVPGGHRHAVEVEREPAARLLPQRGQVARLRVGVQQAPDAEHARRIGRGAAHDAAVAPTAEPAQQRVKVGDAGKVDRLDVDQFHLVVVDHLAVRADNLAEPPATRPQHRRTAAGGARRRGCLQNRTHRSTAPGCLASTASITAPEKRLAVGRSGHDNSTE